MKKSGAFLAALLAFLATQARAAGDFPGHWTGTGTYQTEEMLKAIDADFDLVISQTSKALSIKDCWTYPDPYEGKKTSCYQSDYALDDSAQIFLKDQKIGDVFPGRISIYQSNSQVSELMNFDLNGNNELLLRYNYSNMDGGISIRFAKLSQSK